jgi:hypothetical protein
VLLDVDRRVRERLGYLLVDEQQRVSVVLDDLVIVLQCVWKDLAARIRAADTRDSIMVAAARKGEQKQAARMAGLARLTAHRNPEKITCLICHDFWIRTLVQLSAS